ncbi:hypothetical protein CXB51_002074 [Gossypium anomalum]|uniref:DUF7745 domain-containing protein n=1 Tax=Gossypium anomalum TaxID=47600 RepID=A0A8J5ZN17_9ROSI|nr:hypothetical protein CXB51_002074 [Gossypium anomalum]
MEGCVSNLPEHVTVNVHQNNLEDLVRIWNQWDSDTRGIFTERYGDIANLIAINVDGQLIQAMVRFWDPTYQCFTFNQEGMTPAIEEYAALLRIDNVQFYKIYVKEPKPMTFKKKLMRLTDMTDTWAEKQIKKKNETSCIPWLPCETWLKQGINPVPTILAETFRSLSICRRKGEESYLEKEWPKEVTEQYWVSVFQNLRAEDVTWRAPWIRPSLLLYKVGNQDWVPLLGLWGGVGYAPLMVQRQFSSRQFIPVTGGLAQSEFAFAGEGYMRRV